MYRQHLSDQFADRALMEALQHSPPSSDRPIIYIQTDGMDQSHWSIPRFKNGRCAKALASFKRPRIKLQGVWVSHRCLQFFALDPDQPHDAASVTECVARTLEYLHQQSEVPTEIILWVPCFQQTRIHTPGILCIYAHSHPCTRPTTAVGRTKTGCFWHTWEHYARSWDSVLQQCCMGEWATPTTNWVPRNLLWKALQTKREWCWSTVRAPPQTKYMAFYPSACGTAIPSKTRTTCAGEPIAFRVMLRVGM